MRHSLLALTACLLTSSLAVTSVSAASLQQQRQLYLEAKRALGNNDSQPYLRNAHALKDYPLEPYLAYDELNARLRSASAREVSSFLDKHPDLPQSNNMKSRWMLQLADRGDWSTFNKHYSSGLTAEVDCLYARQEYQRNPKQAQPLVERLWLTGKSQHKACDPLFTSWQNSGGLTEELRWQRVMLAVQAREYGVANFVVKGMGSLQHPARRLIEVAQRPASLEQTGNFRSGDPHARETVVFGLNRLARENPSHALSLLDHYSAQMKLSEEERQPIIRTSITSMARRDNPNTFRAMEKYDPHLRDNVVTETRGLMLIRQARWHELYSLTQRMPSDLAASSRWRYWAARSLQTREPNNPQVQQLYRAAAQDRDFYGFMAADQIKAPYQLNNRPVAPSAQTLNKVNRIPGLQRALELHALRQDVDARREWNLIVPNLNEEELLALARISADARWHFPGIRALALAEYWDDMDIRFPVDYRHDMERNARLRNIQPSWAFAIARQESAFMEDARSHAGAMGLMQLMPATARETAKRYGIPLSNNLQVLQPSTNIALGTAYMSQVAGQFNGNRILASAAYNAGPGRVRQWLKSNGHLPYDVWIENIPFDETRKYVQNVLTYSVIYSQKLGAPQPLIRASERNLN